MKVGISDVHQNKDSLTFRIYGNNLSMAEGNDKVNTISLMRVVVVVSVALPSPFEAPLFSQSSNSFTFNLPNSAHLLSSLQY